MAGREGRHVRGAIGSRAGTEILAGNRPGTSSSLIAKDRDVEAESNAIVAVDRWFGISIPGCAAEELRLL
jgi:hypothetical protein